jgi:hypothetical protein
MRLRAAGGAFVAIVLLVLLLGSGPGAAQPEAAPGDAIGAIQGHPRRGSSGVTERVAEIVARQKRKDQRFGAKPKGPLREKPEPGENPKGENPNLEQSPRPDIGPRFGTELGEFEQEESGEERTPPRLPGPVALDPPVREPLRTPGGPSTPLPASTSFLGAQSSESGFIPPDSMGSVGPTQALVAVNGRIKVFDKQGNLGGLNVSDSTFWTSVRNGEDISDPGVEYDRLSGHWIVTAINLANSENRVMVAVSSGSTITNQSSFTFFFFQSNSSNDFADYPQMAVDKNAIYVGTNDFGAVNFDNTSAFVIRKSSVTGGGPIVVTAFHNLIGGSGAGPFTPQPAQNMDPNVNEGYFIGVDNGVFSQLDIRRVSDPGGTPTLSGNLTLSVPTTRFPEGVPAQGTSTALDPLDDRLFEAMIGRKPDGSLSLWTAHNIEVNSSGVGSTSGGRDAARWYEIGNLGTSPTLLQSGTMFDPAASSPRYFWIPSIAANGQGHASLNSSTAGVGRHAEVASMGRLASDPLGATEPFTITQSSSSNYNVTVTNPQRWGDYSQTVVDPTDNMTFWTFQEYANATNSWGVRVIRLLAPPPATPSAASPSSVPENTASTSVTITGTSTSGSGFFDPGSDSGGPGFPNRIDASVSGGVAVNSVTFVDPTHVTLDLDTTGASTGLKDVTITNPDGQGATGSGLFTVGADTAAPETTIDSGPSGNTTDPDPVFTFSSSEPSEATFQCQLDSTGFTACTSPKGFTGLALGPHLFEVKATDASSNEDPTPAARGFTLVGGSGPNGNAPDTTAPQTKITKGPKRRTEKRKAKFRFTSSEPGSTFECKFDRKPFKPCRSPKTKAHLKVGKHKFKVRATDAAGNTDPTPAKRKWRVVD